MSFMRLRFKPFVILFMILASGAAAQQRRGGVFGQPEVQPAVAPLQPPPVTDPETVLLNVSVTGPQNNAATGLGKERFQVFEDGVEQQIAYFWEDSRPITVGFVLDDSERMGVNDKISVLRDAGASFLKGKRAEDEYFVVRVSDFPDVVVSFTTDPRHMPMTYAAVGETALYDAIHVGLDVIKEAANFRKMLLIITSGGDRCCSDNNKRVTDQQLIAHALKQPVQIYSLFVVDAVEDEESEFVHRDANLLNDLAMVTGGRMSNAPNGARGVEALAAEVARGLKTQYIVGYRPTDMVRDGKRRGVRVRVNSPEGQPKLNVWTKAAYYAPKER
jgi:Ca-activated chloride channel family protein